jgi:hypothetical protein
MLNATLFLFAVFTSRRHSVTSPSLAALCRNDRNLGGAGWIGLLIAKTTNLQPKGQQKKRKMGRGSETLPQEKKAMKIGNDQAWQ